MTDDFPIRLSVVIIIGSIALWLASKWTAYYLCFRYLARRADQVAPLRGTLARVVLGALSLAALWFAWQGTKSIAVAWAILLLIRPVTWLAAVRISAATAPPTRELARTVLLGTAISYVADFCAFIIGFGSLFMVWDPGS